MDRADAPDQTQRAVRTASPDRFAFGENWKAFSRKIDDARILGASEGLSRLLGADEIRCRTFLDIGCGSGVHALAALGLGAAQVTAIDLDSVSVETTRRLLDQYAPGGPWRVLQADVFGLGGLGRFDIVYSWGVLHHTGDLRRALACAADRVQPGGLLCVALYARTSLCDVWKWEKRLYSRSSDGRQRLIRRVYLAWIVSLYTLKAAARGRIFRLGAYRRDYNERGMDFDIDMHDWLGGYPYDSIGPDEVRRSVTALGFREVRSFIKAEKSLGLTGSPCNEFVFRRES